jgi:hypothetical protein
LIHKRALKDPSIAVRHATLATMCESPPLDWNVLRPLLPSIQDALHEAGDENTHELVPIRAAQVLGEEARRHQTELVMDPLVSGLYLRNEETGKAVFNELCDMGFDANYIFSRLFEPLVWRLEHTDDSRLTDKMLGVLADARRAPARPYDSARTEEWSPGDEVKPLIPRIAALVNHDGGQTSKRAWGMLELIPGWPKYADTSCNTPALIKAIEDGAPCCVQESGLCQHITRAQAAYQLRDTQDARASSLLMRWEFPLCENCTEGVAYAVAAIEEHAAAFLCKLIQHEELLPDKRNPIWNVSLARITTLDTTLAVRVLIEILTKDGVEPKHKADALEYLERQWEQELVSAFLDLKTVQGILKEIGSGQGSNIRVAASILRRFPMSYLGDVLIDLLNSRRSRWNWWDLEALAFETYGEDVFPIVLKLCMTENTVITSHMKKVLKDFKKRDSGLTSIPVIIDYFVHGNDKAHALLTYLQVSPFKDLSIATRYIERLITFGGLTKHDLDSSQPMRERLARELHEPEVRVTISTACTELLSGKLSSEKRSNLLRYMSEINILPDSDVQRAEYFVARGEYMRAAELGGAAQLALLAKASSSPGYSPMPYHKDFPEIISAIGFVVDADSASAPSFAPVLNGYMTDMLIWLEGNRSDFADEEYGKRITETIRRACVALLTYTPSLLSGGNLERSSKTRDVRVSIPIMEKREKRYYGDSTWEDVIVGYTHEIMSFDDVRRLGQAAYRLTS